MKSRWFTALIVSLLGVAFLPALSWALSLQPPPDFPLLEAVKKGNAAQVKSILAESPSNTEINQKGHGGDTPLGTAARNGNLEIVKALVERGASIDIGKDSGDWTPLMYASAYGHVETVKYLILKAADVNVKAKGLTPLLLACSRGFTLGTTGDKPKTVRVLLDSGADVNVQDESWVKSGRTPLMYAALQGDAALVQELLAKGARLDFKNKDGETVLALAKKEKLEYIAQLLEKAEKGGSVQPPDKSLHPIFKAVKEGRLDEVKDLIAKGADVNLRASTGSTPLMYAADGNRMEILKYLLKQGADVNAVNGNNNTALIYAAVKGRLAIVHELLRRKADVNIKNISKGDALIYAVINKNTKIVEALLKHGADLNEKYEDEESALILAVKQGSPEIAKLLIAHKAEVNAADKDEKTALIIAAEKGHADLVDALLKAGADAQKKGKDGDTALIKAITGKHVRIAKKLIKCGDFDRREALGSAVIAGNLEIVRLLLTKDTDVNEKRFAGGTLLMLAADDPTLMKFLIEKGADVNSKNDAGETALMKAVESYSKTNLQGLKFLIANGADINAVNNKGESALIQAVKKYKTEMVDVLLEKGSAVTLKDKEGKSAWTYAFEMENKPILKLLEKAGAVRDYKGMEWKGNVSKQAAEFIKVVDNQAEWSDLWKRAFEKPAPDMDFEKYAVACVFLGYSANWLYSISIGRPQQRGNQVVIPYALFDVMLRLSGPFKAGGQYHMLVVEKQKGVTMTMQQEGPSSKKRPGRQHLFE